MEHALTVMERAADAAGRILLRYFEAPEQVRAKGTRDLVSAADTESEQCVLAHLEAAYPAHSVWAEESGYQERPSPYCWYVDPLDGTSNFVMGVPYFSVSLALACEGRVVAALVHNPVLAETYIALDGRGAWRNGSPIRVGSVAAPAESVLGCAYACDDGGVREGLDTLGRLTIATRKVLVRFSPALELCNVARGRMDAYVDNGTTPEDHAAGSLIVREAGGVVRNFAHTDWHVRRPGIVAGNAALVAELTECLGILRRSGEAG